jgi:serine/threonine protein kinase
MVAFRIGKTELRGKSRTDAGQSAHSTNDSGERAVQKGNRAQGPAPEPRATMSAGTILGGKYRLLRLLGQGGMGSVWLAERIGWQSHVAIKLLNLPMPHNPQALARFQREARLAASLRSIHVVQVLDDGVCDETGAPYIVMELLEGETLAERLQRVKCLKPQMVAQIITQIARALGRAHDAGLIHRDLKPDNILLVRNDDEEVVKVLDFGIAKGVATDTQPEHGTLAGHVIGTPAYMSPEQLMSSKTIDHRADLWSLGIIACECMTGARPFEGDNLVSLAFRICSGNPPAASSLGRVPDGFDVWFARAIALNPVDRFASARVMAEELRGLCGQMPMLWLPENTPPPVHQSQANTEFEPVLELTRRVDRNSLTPQVRYPELAGVLNSVHASHEAPRRGRAWLGVSLLLVGLVGGGAMLARSLSLRTQTLPRALAPAATLPLIPAAEPPSPPAPLPTATPEPSSSAAPATPTVEASSSAAPEPVAVPAESATKPSGKSKAKSKANKSARRPAKPAD